MKKILAAALLIAALASCEKSNPWTAIEEGFRTPPDSIKTAVYWYWINNNISKEGVVKDLQAMKRVGINRAFIGNQSTGQFPEGNVKLFSDEWWEITRTAMKTAGELGIEIGMFNCPGWSQSGGPWVTPEQSMKYVEFDECRIKGGGEREIALPDIPDDRIISVLAYPAVDGKEQTWTIPVKKGQPVKMTLRPSFTVRTMSLASDGRQITPVTLTSRGNELASFTFDRHHFGLMTGFKPYAPWVETISETGPGEFVFAAEAPSDNGTFTLTLSEVPVVARYPDKTLSKMFQDNLPPWDYYMWETPKECSDKSFYVDPAGIVDLTSAVKDGKLTWNAPDGEWTILTAYMETTGVTNSPAMPEGTGLEVDKMNRDYIAAHFDAYIGELLRRIPPQDRKTWKVVVEDSYETGSQNWTDDMTEVFRKTYGYDPIPYLPVLRGVIVGSVDKSDRFLWDLRRLIADKVAFDYVGGLRDKAHEHGLQTWLENYGHWGFPGEFLLYGGQSDQVAGEYWSEGTLGNIENKAASSCAHIYGKPQVWAESCTAADRQYSRYPRLMKQRVDHFFCEGINATLLHLYIQQPDDRVPGLDAWFGNEFNRNNAWFDGMATFVEYLKRTNFMLQQGRYVADVAYFIGEDAPKMTGIMDPEIPLGYSYDYINADVLKNHARVKDGKLVLDSGMEYRVLVLPNQKTMRPEMLECISGFVNNGLTIMGPAPERSPSLQNYGEADKRVQELADGIWHGHGGQVYPEGFSLEEVLARMNLAPDFFSGRPEGIEFIHRKLGDMGDIYFISNQKDEAVTISPSFRMDPMQRAEIWDPLTGEITGWDRGKLALDRFQSVFVVFRSDAAPVRPAATKEVTVDGPWTVQFAASAGKEGFSRTFAELSDWAESDDPEVKYYSGSAKFSTKVSVPAAQHVSIDLGEVMVVGRVSVNGKDAGGVWTFPYRLDITGLVHEGDNTIEITVWNNWKNRLIADESLPESERGTWTNIQPWKADSELQSSGLLGPVKLVLIP